MPTYSEYWVDYSARKISGAAMAAARIGPNGERCTGTIRYIDAPHLLSTKHTNKSEYDDLIAHGLKVRLVHQGNTKDADSGFHGGVSRARRAKAGADHLGYTGVIFFTNDRTTLPDPAAWRAYLDGAASVLGRERVGAYGFANALNAAVGHASAFWQAGRESDLVPHTNVYQWNNGRVYISGTECDLNKVIRDYVPGGSSAPSTPTTTQEDEDDEVSYYPKELPVSMNESGVTLPWDGRAAVLNVASTGTVVFVGKPLNWGPRGGTGGGDTTVPGVNPSRVEVNQPGQYHIPAGTTRIYYRWSCATPHFVWVKAT
ncbi:Hypothetical protein AJAP_28180 [Amycolatopsis japonica]|uniref:Rv2525c-like glycoside hydrolase-like domain-containing protein n=1 Tax=Amycolatopsis japonica TaxID=208439 RepID=A0A075V1K4_9PSEU|nr:glycoside hydrolase domain-containing protein [Amycolatopsis japonica]AIG78474.1 Hypothetical protein AJAP_28180 [Amycolatopsis japonica]